MANAKLGWNSNIMISSFLKEATYDAGVTMSSANASTLLGLTSEVAQWPDIIINDKEEFSNKEHGFDQEIIEKRLTMPLSIPKARPHDLMSIVGLGLGSITSTQDAALASYRHKMVPVTIGTDLPSCQIEEKRGNVQQYAYSGVKCDNFKISGESGGVISLEAGLVGSGTRTESATAFAAAITESWMKVANMKAWLEDGTNISITGTLVQDAEDISSATPTDIKAVLQSFEVNWNNNLESFAGSGGAGVLQRLDYKRRVCDLTYTLLFLDKTHLDFYLNQTIQAIEFDLKGAIVIATSVYYFGCQIIIPRFKLKTAPLPSGAPGDLLSATFEAEVFDDGTNAALIVEGYNGQAAYYA